MNSRYLFLSLALITSLIFSGCGATGAAVVGGAVVYGGYKGATDERSLGTMVDDSIISATVKIKMISDNSVKARQIDVDVLNGVVYLIGLVGSSSQKKMATDIAKGIKGVRRVENQLVIGKTDVNQISKDIILTSKIRIQLLKDMDIRSTNIDVDTYNNIITLTGIVKSNEKKKKAMIIVQKVGGDRKIVDNLVVGN
ncbi:BON domain-containing protein [Desulfobacula sp.]|uniref:BON domain-containing protein n=1 Tax=Desulfobacula sp. TaxID=2593537 RepID=UPI0025BDABFC|nr:BON domain-containing protein [Desulfobacula sp.]MBC2704049.1 BON domain-containing protein [Desulfobacula sp.]